MKPVREAEIRKASSPSVAATRSTASASADLRSGPHAQHADRSSAAKPRTPRRVRRPRQPRRGSARTPDSLLRDGFLTGSSNSATATGPRSPSAHAWVGFREGGRRSGVGRQLTTSALARSASATWSLPATASCRGSLRFLDLLADHPALLGVLARGRGPGQWRRDNDSGRGGWM